MRLFMHKLLCLSAIACLAFGFTACSDDDTAAPAIPVLEVTGDATAWGSAEFTVLAENIVEYSWLVLPASEIAPEEIIVFKDGVAVASPATESKIVIEKGLEAVTDYVLYVAGKTVPSKATVDYEFFGEVIAVPFTTQDFTEEFTVIETYADGFRAHLKFPESVKAKENTVIKWGLSNIANYRMQGINDADFLSLNDEYYPAAIVRADTTFVVCEENRWHLNEDGSYWLDPWSEEPVYYWDFLAPGEPLIVMMSEMSWGESLWGWGEGYYVAPFDAYAYEEAMMMYYWGETDQMPNSDDYWTEGSWHRKYYVTTTPPQVYDKRVKVETSNLSTKGGVVTLTPDEGLYAYTFTVLDDVTYKQVLDMALGGDESLLQWFLTSYYAMWTISTQTCFEGDVPPMVILEDYFWELVPGGTYHVIWVGMPGVDTEDGMVTDPMYQSYEHYTFKLPDYTLAAPEVTVTGLEPTSAYSVRFNIKNTGTVPVAEVAYACNYVREFEASLQNGSTYADICSGNREYASLTVEELALVNSADGYTIEISSRESATSRLAAMAWNEEGRPSNPDSEDGKAHADASSAAEPAATPIESPYYESLQGEWTATAMIASRKYDYTTYDYVWTEGTEMTTTVTIGDVTIPEAMTEEAYEVYAQAGHSAESADKYFAELQEETAIFNNKVRGQNRILCQGLQFKSAYALNQADPWKLFTSLEYNANVTADIFYEFGPKWFLQVAEDGSLFVPVNVNRIAPLTKWSDGQDYYLVAGDVAGTAAALLGPTAEDMDNPAKWPNLPVEVSEDGNTITVKALTQDDVTYYPQIVYNSSYYGLNFYTNWNIVSEIVLTRNTASTEEATVSVAATRKAAAQAVAGEGVAVKSANGIQIEAQPAVKSRTAFVGEKAPKIEYKKVEGKALTTEQYQLNLKKFREQSRK